MVVPRSQLATHASGTAAPGQVRMVAALLAALSIACGLLSRALFAGLVAKILGDAFYACLVYALIVAAAPRLRPLRATLLTVLICFAVEFAQLTGWPAQLSARFPPARLVLGATFSVWDLPMYLAGAAAAGLAHLGSRRSARAGAPSR